MKLYLVRNKLGQYLLRDGVFANWGLEDRSSIYHTRIDAKRWGRFAFGYRDDADDYFDIVEIDTEAAKEAVQVLHDLFEAGDLDDHFYSIRESEGLGWEGPRMLKWGKACADARRLMRENP
jgi:hypothetical protein